MVYFTDASTDWHLWRNRLARSAVNRKVAGSSPARCEAFFFFFSFLPTLSLPFTSFYFFHKANTLFSSA